MLEKYPCKILVSKLRDILMFETDFNALHKIIFNQCIIPALEQHNNIPMKIVGGCKGQATINVAINKKLIEDICNEVNTPCVVIITDATNRYDIIAHPFASLTAQHFVFCIDYILELLQAIQSMTKFLCTSFGVSSTFHSITSYSPFQDSFQLNGATPILWLMISIILVRYFCLKYLVSQNCTPISRSIFSLADLLHVDDTDPNVINFSNKPIFEVIT